MLPYFRLLNFTISTYWFMFAIGVGSIFASCILRRKLYEYRLSQSLIIATIITVSGVICVYILGYIESGFSQLSPSQMGALYFSPLFLCVAASIMKIGKVKVINFSAIPICAMLVGMKLGCFLTGCCGGIEINGGLFPVQLVESLILLAILISLFLIELKLKKTIFLYAFYLLSYSFSRFFIEFLRDTKKDLLGMSIGQINAVFLFIIGACILLIIFDNIKSRKNLK